MNIEDSLEKDLKSEKLTPTARERIKTSIKDLVGLKNTELAARARARIQAARASQFKPIPHAIGSAIGGAMAEVVRRNLVGRATSNPYGQALGLLAVGGVVSYGLQAVPYAQTVGAAHCAVAGFIAAAAAHGGNGKPDKDGKVRDPDPVAYALEITTYAHKHKGKKDERERG